MNGVYWGLCSLELMGQGDLFARDDVVAFVKSCWDHPSSSSSSIASSSSDVKGKGKEREVRGGFAPFPRHDAHILSTLSALQILAMKDALGAVDREPFIQCKHFTTRLAAFSLIAVHPPLRVQSSSPSAQQTHHSQAHSTATQHI